MSWDVVVWPNRVVWPSALNAAIDLYLELHRWQVAHILDGIQQADADEFATDDEVKAAFDQWRQ